MNILASYDWLGQYVDLQETPEQFAARVSLSGPGVERLYPQDAGFERIVVGKVLSVGPHPNAEKLRLAKVDIGAKKTTIVCGGSNLREDQWVVVALEGAMVRWHGEGAPVKLEPAEIRGVKSEGMICAANEVGLFDAFPHAEREILDLGEVLPKLNVKPGTNLAVALGLSKDVVLDIEVTTNRPDAMCIVGLAREAAAILQRPFLWKPARVPTTKKVGRALSVQVAEKLLCPRYMGVRMDGVVVGSSPWWLKRRLLSAGLRPINALVDITNFVLMELGQPMHVFDADKLHGAIRVRKAKKGESMAALDGKTYALDETMLVIADDNGPQAIAGIMGGEASAVSSDTRSVVFEAATFDPVSVRRTSRKLNLFSDSQTRFEKGLSVQAPPDALARAVELCVELAGGKVASAIADVKSTPYKPAKFSIKLDSVTGLIGLPLPQKEMADTLKRLGFVTTIAAGKLNAIVPWWRDHDIESGRDLIEEIARVYGYANIPAIFPIGVATRPTDPELIWEDRARTVAKAAGLTETYTYSFVSEELMNRAGFDAAQMLRIQNPLSADFAFMRTTLLPSLLQVVTENQERFAEQHLFEVAHVYYPRESGWKDLPREELMLSGVFFDSQKTDAWKKAKGFAEHLYNEFGIGEVEWRRLENDPFWHPGRSMQAFKDGVLIGTLGQVHPLILERFKIEGAVAMMDLPLETILPRATTGKAYKPLASYPEAKRDLALLVDRDVTVKELGDLMSANASLLRSVEWFDTYRGKGIADGKKSVAFHLTFSHPDRTLETAEVDEATAAITKALEATYKAEVRK